MTDPVENVWKPKPSVLAAVLILLLLIGLGAFLINIYIVQERDRDLQQWESRLGLVADSRAQIIEQVIGEAFTGLEELAGNASLQLYLAQTVAALAGKAGPELAVADPPPQLGYLRNLLIAAGERTGFAPDTLDRVRADLPQRRAGGLALLDSELSPVVTTPGMPPVSPAIREAASRAILSGQRQTSTLQLSDSGQVLFAYAVPINAVLGAERTGSAASIGALVGITDAGQTIFPTLRIGAPFAEDHETLLLEKRDAQVVYLSPTRDGGESMRRSYSLDRVGTAAVQAVLIPGQFIIADNYAGKRILQNSRAVKGQPWVVAVEVDAEQALRESNERQRFLLTSLSLLLLAITAIAIAAWRHGSSVREKHNAERFRQQALKLRQQTELLHAISDNIDVMTILVDQQRQIMFANGATAKATGRNLASLRDTPLHEALGTPAFKKLDRIVTQTENAGETISIPMRLRLNNGAPMYQVSCIPVAQIGERQNLSLLVLSDVTELQETQERHELLLHRVIGTLANVIDLHDPYSAFHSARTAEVCAALGRELGLPDDELETLAFAATLGSIGKLRIPQKVLLKTEPLSEDERIVLEGYIEKGVDLLKNLQFEGPVLSTIAQKQERLDGSGYPRGLTGDQMTLPGKILAVANAFVALVSPRAYREAVPAKAALERLMADADRWYDRQVLAALMHIAENKLDWSTWERQNQTGEFEPYRGPVRN